MIKKSMKLEGLLDEAELATLLESLGLLARADADELLAPQGLKALKLSVRKRYGQIYTTLKIERDAPAPAPGDAAVAAEATPQGVCAALKPRPVKYSTLKKRLRESFRAVTVNLAQDRLPPEEAVEDFLADSARVTCFPATATSFMRTMRAPTRPSPPPGGPATSPPCRRRPRASRAANAAATRATLSTEHIVGPVGLFLLAPPPHPYLASLCLSSRIRVLRPCVVIVPGVAPPCVPRGGLRRQGPPWPGP